MDYIGALKLGQDNLKHKTRKQGGQLGMNIIDVGKIRISPFEFESILEVRIEKGLNEHSTLYVSGIIKDCVVRKPFRHQSITITA